MAKIEDGQGVRAPWPASDRICVTADNPKNAPSPRSAQGQVIRFPSACSSIPSALAGSCAAPTSPSASDSVAPNKETPGYCGLGISDWRSAGWLNPSENNDAHGLRQAAGGLSRKGRGAS